MRRFVGPRIATERDSWYLATMLSLTDTIGTGAQTRYLRLRSGDRAQGCAQREPPVPALVLESVAAAG